jgi:hypothetical protein
VSITDADLREQQHWIDAEMARLRTFRKREPWVEEIIRIAEELSAETDQSMHSKLHRALADAAGRLARWKP